MGSVKDLEIVIPAYENRRGFGNFHFSDRYSVFDWGEMPDQIRNKGRALNVMASYNFRRLAQMGISTCFGGLRTTDKLLDPLNLEEGSEGIDTMGVYLAVKYDPIARKFEYEGEPRTEYDYSFFDRNRGKLGNFLVPLEIIFRNGLPKGSSVFKRLKDAENDPKKIRSILNKLGLTEIPEENSMLPKPVIQYTTKLEASDRTLTEIEAYIISGLTSEQFSQIGPLALRVNEYLNERAEITGLNPHWDGKVEMIYNNGLGLGDVVGTPDENRFGDRISKEFLRQWYKDNQPAWGKACDEHKKTGPGWQDRCPIKPMNLPPELSKLFSQMYMSATNKWVQKQIFPKVPELEKIMEDLKEFRD